MDAVVDQQALSDVNTRFVDHTVAATVGVHQALVGVSESSESRGVHQTPAVGVNGNIHFGHVSFTSPMTLHDTTVVHFEKPEKFNGQNFKIWQMKMDFYLYQLGVKRVLKDGPPKLGENDHDTQGRIAYEMWMEDNYLCWNHIMNCLSDNLYKVYTSVKTAKELWEQLDKRYRCDDVDSKNHIVSRFLDFKMVDSLTVQSQVLDLLLIYNEIAAKDMVLSESFRVAAMIEKLPPAWKDFKNTLKHNTKQMSLIELQSKLEKNQSAGKKVKVITDRANVVDHCKAKKNQKFSSKLAIKEKSFKKQKSEFKGKCFNCGKLGHIVDECRLKKMEVNAAEVDDDESNFVFYS